MVSTRGVKLKFSENERVLCYEPDPTKAKVLYDSKVLDVVIAKDHRGKKSVEYLIHFQGWNSSWDRYVSEEYVLKDTPENRQLQRDLAEKSQLQLGAYLYRKDRKKSRKISTIQSSDDGSSSSPARMDTDDGHEVTSTSEDDSSLEDELVPIELTAELKACLEQDYCLINTKNKLVKLPAEPNIITILENYFKQHRYTFGTKGRPEDVKRNLSICTEVLDGIRIYFDYTVKDLLLYKSEQGQIETRQAVYPTAMHLNNDDTRNKNLNCIEYLNFTQNFGEEDSQSDKALQRKRSLRSSKTNECITNGNSCQDNTKVVSSTENNGSLVLHLLPEHIYFQQPPPPCLVYGAIHLTRLFVKLPELLNASNIEESKWKTLLHHLNSFVEFLNDHQEWFGERFYIDK